MTLPVAYMNFHGALAQCMVKLRCTKQFRISSSFELIENITLMVVDWPPTYHKKDLRSSGKVEN